MDGAYDAGMSEQPDTSVNGQAPPAALAAPSEQASGFEMVLAVAAILIGFGVIILGLDTMTGGRLLGFVTAPQQEE